MTKTQDYRNLQADGGGMQNLRALIVNLTPNVHNLWANNVLIILDALSLIYR